MSVFLPEHFLWRLHDRLFEEDASLSVIIVEA